MVLPACRAVGIGEFTRIDCRFDAGGATHGELKAFDVNGMPGLELPFSTSVWQMIVKMQHSPELHAYDTLIALIIYCAGYRHNMAVPARITELAQEYINSAEAVPA